MPFSVAGTIPAPVFFGAMIDRTCQLWQKPCSDKGACLFYDNNTMGRYLLAMVVCGKGVAFLFFMMSVALYRPPPKVPQLTVMPEEAMSSNSTVQMFLKDNNKVPVDTKELASAGNDSSAVAGEQIMPNATVAITRTSSSAPSSQARYQQLAQWSVMWVVD